MQKKTAAYFRARIALIDDLLSRTPDTGEKNNAHVLLRNGVIPAQLLNGKSEETAVMQKMSKGDYSNTPLTFFELCRWNTWFALHPEKVAGTEMVTTSLEFPVTIKGTKEDIINTLTPVVSEEKEKEAPAAAKLSLKNLKKIMPLHQQKLVMNDPEHAEVLQRLEKEAAEVPGWGRSNNQTKDEVIVHLHYFFRNSDWYITEWGRKHNEFFGYVILNGDAEMSEYGAISIEELTHNPYPIELDFYWIKKTLAEALFEKDPDYFPQPENKLNEEKQQRMRIAKAKAKAKLKLLELLKI